MCSASESTSCRVEIRCCDSTTRHGVPSTLRRLDLPPHSVQIPRDMDESFDGPDEFRGNAAQVQMLAVEPLLAALAVTEQAVEPPEDPQEEQRAFTLCALGLNHAPGLEPGHARGAHAQDVCEHGIRDAELCRCSTRRLRQNCRGVGGVRSSGTELRAHLVSPCSLQGFLALQVQ